MFLDKFNENNIIKAIDETKYKSVFDLQLECIQSEYELDCILEDTDLGIVNESVSDKLKQVGEYLKKLWERFKAYIKKAWEWINKKFIKICDKIKNYKNKDLKITNSFELIEPKFGEIKFVDYKDLEKLFNLNIPDIHNDIQIRKFIEDFKDINLDDVKKKVLEKLASAIGIPDNKFTSDFNLEKDLGVNKIKIETSEDLKKTKYYNSLIKGIPENKYKDLYNKISDNISKNDNKISSVFAGMTDINHVEADDHSTFKKFINGNSEFNKAIDIYVKIERVIYNNYIIYNNIIVKGVNMINTNYSKILKNCKLNFKSKSNLELNDADSYVDDVINGRII